MALCHDTRQNVAVEFLKKFRSEIASKNFLWDFSVLRNHGSFLALAREFSTKKPNTSAQNSLGS